MEVAPVSATSRFGWIFQIDFGKFPAEFRERGTVSRICKITTPLLEREVLLDDGVRIVADGADPDFSGKTGRSTDFAEQLIQPSLDARGKEYG
jgi:hypothetical protein